jgi:hypothetical protein
MQRKHLVIGVGGGVVVAGVVVWLLALRGGAGGGSPGGDAPDRASGPGLARGVPAEVAERQREVEGAARRTADPPDPAGRLLVEGQVLGDDDLPVGGAEVWISTVPPRSATTEADGGFSFDRLLPREYSLSARRDDAIGGPVRVAIGPGAEPVVIRLREGARLNVRVTAEVDGGAVEGAAVELRELGTPTAVTGKDGVATFRGLGAGWSVVTARAAGFAPRSALASIGGPGSHQDVTVALRRGAAIAGKVVDEAGAPVKAAYVTLREASSAFSLGGGDATVSGDDGAFAFTTVAAGSYTIAARDGEHAPGTSEIVTVDGITAVSGVTVVLTTGGAIRGRVVTRQHAPAPFAAVEVAPSDVGGMAAWTGFGPSTRRVTADDHGRFEMKGLPRGRVRVRAETDEAASAITDVDLGAQAVVDQLELVLDVEGTIAGIVVDAKDDPVAEAQVSAIADLFDAAGEARLEDFAFSGFTATTTDGGGQFRIRGLPEGAYRLRASRTGAIGAGIWGTEGTKARTGDTAVRIVLPAPGGIEGRIAFADGTAPERALIGVGVLPAAPTRDGAFAVHDLPPGRYDVRVRGPDFAELIHRGVEVQAGAITDVGTLTVERGRRLTGRVVDAGGTPVGGARVIAGEMLVSEGGAGGNPAIEDEMGLRTAISQPDGSFAIQGAPAKGGAVMAEHADRGRSPSIGFAAGTEDVTGLTLALRGFGSIAGKVTMKGQPVPGAQVMASARASTGHVVVVNSGSDGSYVIDKIPEGEHRLSVHRRHNLQMSSTTKDVRVSAGERATVDLEIPVGSITLTVEIRGKDGATIDAAQIFLFVGGVEAKNAKDITERFIAGDAVGMDLWFGGPSFPAFKELVPGSYSVCVLPIAGDLADPQLQRRLQENLERLDVHCEQDELEAAPLEQRHVAVVPPMTPLPVE